MSKLEGSIIREATSISILNYTTPNNQTVRNKCKLTIRFARRSKSKRHERQQNVAPFSRGKRQPSKLSIQEYIDRSSSVNDEKKRNRHFSKYYLARGDSKSISTISESQIFRSESVWQSDWLTSAEDNGKYRRAKHKDNRVGSCKKGTDRLRSPEGTFRVHKIYGDGNCMFRAISYIIWGSEDEHRSLRNTVANHIQNNWGEYGPFVMAEWNISNRQQYFDYMNTDGTYASELECTVATKLYRMNLLIYREINDTRDIEQVFYSHIGNNYRTARLLFSGRSNCGHYDVLFPD